MDTVRLELTPEQQLEAERIEDLLLAKMRLEAKRVSRLLAAKEDRELLGPTEFEVRDACHRVGAAALNIVLEQRKKGGTKDRR